METGQETKDWITQMREKYPNQFKAPGIGYWANTGWRGIVEHVFEQIDNLGHGEPILGWVQIKEKFGALQMYHSTMTEDADILRRINEIVAEASYASERTCHICGSPGRLYASEYWATLCDAHAAEGERLFPPKYGVWLNADGDIEIGGKDGRKTVCAIYLKNALIYTWRAHGDHREYIFTADLPELLADLAKKKGLPQREFFDWKAYLFEDIQSLVYDYAGAIEKAGLLAMPEGVLVDPDKAFSYGVHEGAGRRVRIESIAETRKIRVGEVAYPDGSLRIWKSEDGEVVEVHHLPEVFLERRAREMEKVAKELREMLKRLEQNKKQAEDKDNAE